MPGIDIVQMNLKHLFIENNYRIKFINIIIVKLSIYIAILLYIKF